MPSVKESHQAKALRQELVSTSCSGDRELSHLRSEIYVVLPRRAGVRVAGCPKLHISVQAAGSRRCLMPVDRGLFPVPAGSRKLSELAHRVRIARNAQAVQSEPTCKGT